MSEDRETQEKRLMAEKEIPKICPFMSLRVGTEGCYQDCKEEQCAVYFASEKMCSFRLLAFSSMAGGI